MRRMDEDRKGSRIKMQVNYAVFAVIKRNKNLRDPGMWLAPLSARQRGGVGDKSYRTQNIPYNS